MRLHARKLFKEVAARLWLALTGLRALKWALALVLWLCWRREAARATDSRLTRSRAGRKARSLGLYRGPLAHVERFESEESATHKKLRLRNGMSRPL